MDKYTKRDATGAVDVTASAAAYAEALNKWAAENEVSSETIENAVEAVFDRFDGQRLPKPAFVSFVVTELQATPEQHKTLTERVQAYLKGQQETGRVETGRGKTGGIVRVVRPGEPIPEKPAKPDQK